MWALQTVEMIFVCFVFCSYLEQREICNTTCRRYKIPAPSEEQQAQFWPFPGDWEDTREKAIMSSRLPHLLRWLTEDLPGRFLLKILLGIWGHPLVDHWCPCQGYSHLRCFRGVPSCPSSSLERTALSDKVFLKLEISTWVALTLPGPVPGGIGWHLLCSEWEGNAKYSKSRRADSP